MSVVFWDVTPCNSLLISHPIEEHITGSKDVVFWDVTPCHSVLISHPIEEHSTGSKNVVFWDMMPFSLPNKEFEFTHSKFRPEIGDVVYSIFFPYV
jgi:hypothetical protein